MDHWLMYLLAAMAYCLIYFLASVFRDSGHYMRFRFPIECITFRNWLYHEVIYLHFSDKDSDDQTWCHFTRLLGFEFESFFKKVDK